VLCDAGAELACREDSDRIGRGSAEVAATVIPHPVSMAVA